jgi:hypothetical protein
MATKKQQRRRVKSKRHEYEYAYVDEDGNEVEPPSATPAPRKDKAPTGKAAPRGRRAVKPPTWPRAAKWAAGYTAILIVLLIRPQANKGIGSIVPAVLSTIALGALIVPAIYWMHRLQFRTYEKMLAKQSSKSR